MPLGSLNLVGEITFMYIETVALETPISSNCMLITPQQAVKEKLGIVQNKSSKRGADSSLTLLEKGLLLRHRPETKAS